MRTPLVAIALLTLTLPLTACTEPEPPAIGVRNWHYVGMDTQGQKAYIDLGSIKRQGDRIEFDSQLLGGETPVREPIKSTCTGNLAYVGSDPSTYITPGSILDGLIKEACARS
jgi:hypothetical protein